MGARSGGGGGARFGSEFGSLPRGGFSQAPFKGAAKISSLKEGDTITDQNGNKFKISIAKSSKNQVVIGSSMLGTDFNETTWMVANKNAYINGKKV